MAYLQRARKQAGGRVAAGDDIHLHLALMVGQRRGAAMHRLLLTLMLRRHGLLRQVLHQRAQCYHCKQTEKTYRSHFCMQTDQTRRGRSVEASFLCQLPPHPERT